LPSHFPFNSAENCLVTLPDLSCKRPQALTFPDGSGPDLIVDDGGDATLLIHKGYELEKYYAKNGNVPEITTKIEEEIIIENLIREVLKKDPNHWH
jgi:adenosylhomocysteinase